MKMIEVISVFVIICLLFLVIKFEINFILTFFRNNSRRFSYKTIFLQALIAIIILCFAYSFFIEPHWLEVKHIEIKTKKLANSEFTIVQISDLHCDEKIRNEEKIVKIINDIHPDAVVFTGDAINTRKALPVFKNVLKRLKSPVKAAVRGNWDANYWQHIDLFENTGFEELRNGAYKLISKTGESIVVTGMGPRDFFSINKELKSLQPDKFIIFLYHYPGINEEFGNNNIDLYLSGHTHGGQIALPFYGAIITLSKYGKKYEGGAYKLDNDTMLYVNRGAGMEGGLAPRLRFFARPEITVFHITPDTWK